MAKKSTLRTISGSRLESIYASYVKEYERMLKIEPKKVSPIKFTKAELKVRYEQSRVTAKDSFIKQSVEYQSYAKYKNTLNKAIKTGSRKVSSFAVSYDEYQQFFSAGGLKGISMNTVLNSENYEVPDYVIDAAYNVTRFMGQADVRRGMLQYMNENEIEISDTLIKDADAYLNKQYEDAMAKGLKESTIEARKKRLDLSDAEKVQYYLTHLTKSDLKRMSEDEIANIFNFAKEAGLSREVIQQAISYKEEDANE